MKENLLATHMQLNRSTLLLVLQSAALAGVIYFIMWTPVYDVVVWNKPVLQSLQDGYYNLIYAFVSLALFLYARFSNLAMIVLMIAGAVSLVFSIIYTSQILAFIGLGLTFWGIIIRYITSEEYVKKRVLEATILTPLAAFDDNISSLKYDGQAIYLPPRYLADTKSNKVCILKNQETSLPTPLEAQSESELTAKNAKWLLLTPPGNGLAKLFEKTLKTALTKIDLSYMEHNLPRLLAEDLEIAETVQIQSVGKIVKITLRETIFAGICKETDAPNFLGSPIASAIGCVLTKAIGKPIAIRSEQLTEDGETIIIEYEILEPPKEKPD